MSLANASVVPPAPPPVSLAASDSQAEIQRVAAHIANEPQPAPLLPTSLSPNLFRVDAWFASAERWASLKPTLQYVVSDGRFEELRSRLVIQLHQFLIVFKPHDDHINQVSIGKKRRTVPAPCSVIDWFAAAEAFLTASRSCSDADVLGIARDSRRRYAQPRLMRLIDGLTDAMA